MALKKMVRGDETAWVEPGSQAEREMAAAGFAPEGESPPKPKAKKKKG